MTLYRESGIGTDSEDTGATEEFVMLMDKFFDCFNVRSMNEGKKARKTTRDPYWSASDWRFTVSLHMHVLGICPIIIIIHVLPILSTVAQGCIFTIHKGLGG